MLDAVRLAKILTRKLVLRGAGIPQGVAYSRKSQFTSKFWAAFCHHLSINQRLSTVCHSHMDLLTEHHIQTLKQYLCPYVNYLQDNWVHWLPLAEFACNNSAHGSISVTPFFAKKGSYSSIEAIVLAIPFNGSVSGVPELEAWEEKLVEHWAAIEQRWKKVNTTQWKCANRRTWPNKFGVSDLVWLSSKNIHTKHTSKKLNYRFDWPYLVVEWIGTQAYRLNLL